MGRNPPFLINFSVFFEVQLLRRLIIWNYQSGHGSSLQILVKPFSGKAPLLLNFVDTAIALVSFIKRPFENIWYGIIICPPHHYITQSLYSSNQIGPPIM
jgi:hypothetical protein